MKPAFDIVDAKSGEVISRRARQDFSRAAAKAAKDGLTDLLIPTEEIFGRYSANDLIDEATGRIQSRRATRSRRKTRKHWTRQGSTGCCCSISTVNTGPLDPQHAGG
ncbi:MAG: hypothetical protein R3D83_04735 [Caenibius sp.]